MRDAEQVTFGGSALDRVAEIRGDAKAVARLLADDRARVLPLWRGKPLLAEGGAGGGWLAPGHKALKDATEALMLIGRDEGAPRFAVDISSWEPEETPDTLGAFFDPSVQVHPAIGDGMAFAELRAAMAGLTPREAELIATAKALTGWHATHRFCARCGGESTPGMAGWQRDCAACGAHHFPRTDPVVIMLILHGNDVLLGRSPGWPEGMYSLLAGFIEPGETIEAAVRREVAEETQVRVGRVDYLASQPWPFPASLMIGCRGEATSREITIDPVEIEHAMWVSREEMAVVFAGNSTRIRPARKGSIAHFLLWHWLADRLD